MNYNEKLKNPKWQKKRLKILERDNFSCVHCRDTETTLNVHHKKYTGEPWDAPDKDLETVCEDCHSIIDDIESIIYCDKFNCLKINKTKHVNYFMLNFVLGDCQIGEGVIFLDSQKRDVYLLKKEELVDALNTINNG